MKFKRILLKLSGESLMGKMSYGIDPEQLSYYCNEIINASNHGIQIGIVIGGGNIFRGIQGMDKGFNRIDGDYMGMLATVMNSLALKSELEKLGKRAIVFSGIEILPLCSKMHSGTAKYFLEQDYIVIIAGGTGNPFFTTDSAAALRALEINAEVLLKGTRVDGVFSSDPEKYPDAEKYNTISFSEAYEKKLNIMDMTAFTLCMENNLPVIVFNINLKGNLEKVINGENTGTLVHSE
jgi:uridylate kinase